MTKPTLEKFVLKYENAYKETFFFVRLGEDWPHEPRFKLIAQTTAKKDEATEFETIEAAESVLKSAGSPGHWTVCPK